MPRNNSKFLLWVGAAIFVIGMSSLLISLIKSRSVISAEVEEKVWERLDREDPGKPAQIWSDLSDLLGDGETATLEEFKTLTGYKLIDRPSYECKIWRGSDGAWIAVAIERESSAVSFKTYVRR